MNILTGNSIRQRFILTLGSIVVLIIMVFSAVIIYQNVSAIESQLNKRMRDASELAKQILPNALWQYNNDYVADFIDSLFLYEDIVFVKVVSGDVAIKEKSRSGFLEKNFLSFQNSSRFSTKETSIGFNGKVIGKIQIVISRERIKKTILQNSVLTIIFVIFIISAIISIIYFNSNRYIFTPLSRLENSAAEISKGNWDADIDISGSDEIGNLSKTFHQMIQNLKATTTSRNEFEQEIRERRQAQEAEKQEQALSRTIIDSIPGTFYMIDKAGQYIRWNAYQRDEIVGKSEMEIAKTNALDTIHPDDRHLISSKIANVLKTGSEEIVESRVLLRGGPTFRWFLMTGRRIIIKDSPFLIGTGIDITVSKHVEEEREKLQKEVLKARKLESLGTLAGGIAHDLNNLLYVVMGNISLAQDDLKPETETSEILKEAQKACIKAKELSARLITFSKGGDPVKKMMSIKSLLKDTVISVLSGSNIKPEISISDDIRQANIDQGQIKQVVSNIVANAKEAMDDNGQLKVSCENIYITEKGYLTLNQGQYIKISFADQGCGISKENLEKIFDPYFSTKDMGTDKGQGLGLTVSYSVVQKHGGLINVESEPGTGSTVSIYLPAISIKEPDLQKSEEKPTAQKPVKQPATGTGKILLMDDEKAIRKFLGKVISRLGYDIETCIEGKEAVEIYTKAMESNEPFHVVILDLTNTIGMGGQATMKRLLDINPDVKGIIITGYSDDPVVANFRAYGFSGVIIKPATKEELSKVIKEVL